MKGKSMVVTRRDTLIMIAALPLGLQMGAGMARADTDPGAAWTVQQTFEALTDDAARLLDIRTREEWRATGVARGAWPVSMHDPRFPERLFAARDLADGRKVALICATGGRSGAVMRAILQAGHGGFVDVPEGMMGSAAGPGWIKAGLPVVSASAALKALPPALA